MHPPQNRRSPRRRLLATGFLLLFLLQALIAGFAPHAVMAQAHTPAQQPEVCHSGSGPVEIPAPDDPHCPLACCTLCCCSAHHHSPTPPRVARAAVAPVRHLRVGRAPLRVLALDRNPWPAVRPRGPPALS